MRVSVGYLKVGMKFSKTASGPVLEVTSIDDDGVVYYSGGETGVSLLAPHYARPVWVVDAPKVAAAPAPKKAEPAPKVEEEPKSEKTEAEDPKPKKKKSDKPSDDEAGSFSE
jgi:hypothetical protein